ncbi:MAG: sulfatase-like hydrolase/transferase [Verrucomicrobiales bacterium]|nr:sulfatase-like hydrolase/transferase [Verrucomicrobiales bacterium]MCP5527376.1 sulfatase-like hydrolase/transferase [Verrucomicrobiales bacterium]
MKSRAVLLVVCGAWLAMFATLRLVAADRPPNVIYFMADELGYYELSGLGNPHLQTPNLDRMAAEGVRFTQALAGSSVCAPTRACLMTGKHSGHTSVRSNGGGTPLRAGEPTIASLLKEAGYATGGFGKWGCGGRGSTGVPEEHGFDVFVGYYDQVHAHSYYPAYIVRNSEELVLPGNVGGRSGQTYSHYVIMEQARQFIRANATQPFFCYLPVTPPHGLFDIPDTDPAWALFKDEDWPEEAKRYAAMVSMVDRQVGELFDLLRELGLDERTIVFFSGDNGGADYFPTRERPRGFHGANVNPLTGTAFRGKKGNLYEGGLRIPMIVRWPGHIQPGQVSDLLWYFPDVLPTVAELAGVKPPADIDGISIVPELLGATAAGRPQPEHEFLYWELGSHTAVRMNDWKAVRPRPDAAWELYDLRRDPGEAHDLAATRKEVLDRLTTIAAKAHEPVREGVFHSTALHERDRRAKFGENAPQNQTSARVESLPTDGLLSNAGWKIQRVSSENRPNRKYAANAIDGDPRTIWHTQFADTLARYPHEICLDLGAVRTVRGFYYLARQDAGWNGAIKECEFSIGTEPDQLGEPVARATLRRVRQAQRVDCAPVRGRYVLLRALSEVNDGPWASAAEIGVIGE